MSIAKAEKEVELLRVQASKAEMKLNIMKKEDEIERIKLQIENQIKREQELKSEIGEN